VGYIISLTLVIVQNGISILILYGRKVGVSKNSPASHRWQEIPWPLPCPQHPNTSSSPSTARAAPVRIRGVWQGKAAEEDVGGIETKLQCLHTQVRATQQLTGEQLGQLVRQARSCTKAARTQAHHQHAHAQAQAKQPAAAAAAAAAAGARKARTAPAMMASG